MIGELIMINLWYIKSTFEILFFSSIVYYFSLWLKKDKRHNLLIHFYAYCGLFLIAGLLNLATIVTFLIYGAPIALMLFIIFHQELLQRNFITLKHTPIALQDESADWAEHLIRASLHAINNNKQLMCVIEHRSDLKPFLNTSLIFNSPIAQNLLTVLIDSNGFDQEKMIWCSTYGKLIGINASWNINHHESWQSPQVKELPSWQQDALLMTLKTDTIIFKANPSKRAFDLIVKGAVQENIPAHHLLALIKKQISSSNKGDSTHDRTDQKRILEQPNS